MVTVYYCSLLWSDVIQLARVHNKYIMNSCSQLLAITIPNLCTLPWQIKYSISYLTRIQILIHHTETAEWDLVESLQRELTYYKLKVDSLMKHFFISDACTLCHTRMPNYKLVKAVFDHVVKGLPADGTTKLSHFQEFVCYAKAI